MGRKNQTLILAQKMAREIIAEQTRARVMLGFDAALVTCNRLFNLGPGRAQAFCRTYGEVMDELAGLYVEDGTEDGDIVYAKAKRDELIKSIVGPENFKPFDEAYGRAYMDEAKRIRVMRENAGETGS